MCSALLGVVWVLLRDAEDKKRVLSLCNALFLIETSTIGTKRMIPIALSQARNRMMQQSRGVWLPVVIPPLLPVVGAFADRLPIILVAVPQTILYSHIRHKSRRGVDYETGLSKSTPLDFDTSLRLGVDPSCVDNRYQ